MLSNLSGSDKVETAWNELKTCIFESFDLSCCWTKVQQNRKETWWWNDTVELTVKEKRTLRKAWKKGGSKESYLIAKCIAKQVVYNAKKAASEERFSNLHEKEKLNHVFRLARKMKSENRDIV